MSYATVINWLDDVEKQDHVVYDTPEAVLALLAEIRTDVVGIVSTAETYDVLAAFEAKRSMLSSGESGSYFEKSRLSWPDSSASDPSRGSKERMVSYLRFASSRVSQTIGCTP